MKFTYHFNVSFRAWIILGDAKTIQNIVKTDFSRPLHVRSQTIITARNSNAFESLNATISSKTLLSRVDTFRYLQKDTTYVDFT